MPILARLLASRGGLLIMAAAAFWAFHTARVEWLRAEVDSQKERYVMLLAKNERELMARVAEEQARADAAAKEAEAFADMIEEERERTSVAQRSLAAARGESARLLALADQRARDLEVAREQSDDECKPVPVPDAYRDGLSDLLNAVYFGGYGGGDTYDFDAPPISFDGPGVEDTSAGLPAGQPADPCAASRSCDE